MSHTRTVIEPDCCLTVLTGPNNCGKSAVVAALQVLCTNERGGFMLRHGQKEVRVSVETQDGECVEWRRKKSGPVTYVVNGREVHRGIPDDLHEVIRLPRVAMRDGTDEFDVHFGEQKSPIFLIDQSGRHAATFFASSSDAEYMMRMQAIHKRRTTAANLEERRLAAEVLGLDRKLAVLEPGISMAGRIEALALEYVAIGVSENSQATLRKHLFELEAVAADASISLETYHPFLELAAEPVLHETPALSSMVAELTAAGSNLLSASGEFVALSRTLDLPILHDADTLSASIEALLVNHHAIEKEGALRQIASRIPEPPELSDEQALASCVTDLTRHLIRERYLREGLEGLERLAPCEEMLHVAGVDGAIRILVETSFKRALADEQVATLATLAELPIEKPTSPLAMSLEEILSATQAFENASAMSRALKGMPDLEVPLTTSGLQAVIADLAEAQAGHEQCLRSVAHLGTVNAALQIEIESWISTNPVCPVCNQILDQNRLLQPVGAVSA